MPTPRPFKRNASYDDLTTIPENWIGQIIDGDLWAFPRPASGHALAVTDLLNALAPLHKRHSDSGWIFLADVEVRFGPHLLVPDISGWRRERMPEVPTTSVFELAPDWVCEVLSPSTRHIDRGRKRELYAKGNVHHIWWVDPEPAQIDVLALDGPSYRMTDVAGVSGCKALAPFEDIELDFEDFWRR